MANDIRLDPALEHAATAAGFDPAGLPRVYMFINPNEVKVRRASCCCEGREPWSECSVCLADTLIFGSSQNHSEKLAKSIMPTRLLVSTEGADLVPQFVSSPSTSSASSQDFVYADEAEAVPQFPSSPSTSSVSSQDCSSDESENQHSQAIVQQAEEQREALKRIRAMQTGHAAPRWFEQSELFPDALHRRLLLM